jgi:L-ribulose-5-phosphate 3-epimerase
MNRTYSLGIYEKAFPENLSLEEKLEKAKDFGFDFLEISIDESDEKLARLDMDELERKSLLNTIKRTIPLGSICLSAHRKYPLGSEDEETVKRSLKIMEKAIHFSTIFGIRIIMLAGYDTYYEPSNEKTRQNFEERLDHCIQLAAMTGVILAFETMETPFMNSVAKAMHHIRLHNSPFLQIYPDIGNITNASLLERFDVWKDLESGAGHIVALHLKDSKPGVYRNLSLGEGHVDFANAIATTWRMGVRIFVTEFWESPDKPWKSEITTTHAFATALLDKQKDSIRQENSPSG